MAWTTRVVVFGLLAVCLCLALLVGAALVAPDALEPLLSLPYASEIVFGFVTQAPMLVGIPLAWGLLALGGRIWKRHVALAWPVGVLVFVAMMDLLPAWIWLNGFPLGDRFPGMPDPTFLERMGSYAAQALACGLVVATLWWLMLASRRPQ